MKSQTSHTRLIARNGAFAAAQVIIASAGYLVAYRTISQHLGVAKLGAWALCLSTAAICSVADLGVSDGMVRMVAHKSVSSNKTELRALIVTGVAFTFLGSGIGAALAWPLLELLIGNALGVSSEFQRLIFPAIISTTLTSIALSLQGVLEGLERYGLRLIASVASAVFLAMGTLIFVPLFGMNAVFAVYIGQGLFSLILFGSACYFLVLRHGEGSLRPTWSLAKELSGVGLPIKATALASFALDPVTRLAVTHYGGPLAAGNYEIAARFILQLRSLLVSSFQAGLPRLVKLRAATHISLPALENQIFRIAFLVGIGAFTAATLSTPIICLVVLGQFSRETNGYAVLLSAGWCLNAISAPFYFSLLAERRLGVIWASAALMASTNLALCAALGRWLGPQGAVIALALAVAAGSLLTIVKRISSSSNSVNLFGAPEFVLLTAAAFAIVGGVGTWGERWINNQLFRVIFALCGFSVAFSATLWISLSNWRSKVK